MKDWLKKVLLILVIAFAAYYLISRPVESAHAVKSFFGMFRSIGRFFSSLAS